MALVQLWEEVLLRSDICSAWTVLADTDRQNRLIGLAPLEVSPAGPSAGAARYEVRSRLGGLAVTWEDLPTEFVRFERFHIRRRFTAGPLRRLEVEALFKPEGTGTRLRLVLAVEPTLAVLRPVARFNARRSLRAMLALAQELDANGGAAPSGRGLVHPPSAAAFTRISRALEGALPEALRPLGARLCEHVAKAPDHDLVRIRPWELADSFGVPREGLLHVCLVAVVEGLLELKWDAVCPSCRGPSTRVAHLSELSQHADCTLCDLRFELTLDESLEATFSPAPSVREVEVGPFCIGGPARLPHVVAQALLPKDASVTLQAPVEPGRYRLFIRGGETVPVKVEADGAPSAVFSPGVAALQLRPGASVEVPPRGVDTHVKLEHLTWASRAVTAQDLSLTPGFRRLFAREALRPGVALAVKRVALLFTDLTGSTALYSKVGDAVAFGLVQAHFDLLSEVVEAHGGAVVKTIGDAVMAALPDEERVVQAALQMQRVFATFATGANGPLPKDALKVGLYCGPCYAVSANGALDYFGQSVNIAARLQGAAGPGEIVLPADVADRAGLRGERFLPQLKGLEVPLWAARLLP